MGRRKNKRKEIELRNVKESCSVRMGSRNRSTKRGGVMIPPEALGSTGEGIRFVIL